MDKSIELSNLIDGLRNMIDSGRLTEGMIPDDFQWLLRMLDADEQKQIGSSKDRVAFQSMAAYAPLPWTYSPVSSENIVDANLRTVCKSESGNILAMILTAVNTYSGFKTVNATLAIDDLVEIITRQRDFSIRTFGPGQRALGLVDHIKKELAEIEANPRDPEEWIDVALLALDGAWRAGCSPDEVANTLISKLSKNESRTWPDWHTSDPNSAIEHLHKEPSK